MFYKTSNVSPHSGVKNIEPNSINNLSFTENKVCYIINNLAVTEIILNVNKSIAEIVSEELDDA